MKVTALFPIPLGSVNINRDITKQEREFIFGLEMGKNMGNYRSLNTNVLAEPRLADIRNFIIKSLDLYFTEIYQPQEANLRITQSWINLGSKGEYHHKHYHPNSFISGVMYLQTNTDDKIQFFNGKQDPFILFSKNYNMFNSDSWWIPASQGELILFPSSLQHMVTNIQAAENKQRISLSFNTFFVKTTLGSENSLTELVI